ncbi:hypothetical protein [Bdellovibrio sp. HCB2-146]|uniref:hypothetical protein n=1 Tax=Bdellovibrio sp. HCB2-146 TaxID=3394362 RepID=UPI0039BC95A6
MKAVSILTLLAFLVGLSAEAAIIPTRSILQKTAENSGSGIYSIEQEVQFTVGEETLTVKETWLIENDRTMRLAVSGSKDLNFRLQNIYNGGQKWSLQNGTRKSESIPSEFLERFFNFRNPEIFANALAHFQIIPPGSYSRKPFARAGADFKYDPESWVRYSRTGGVVNYALGTPTPAEQENGNPGIWIEQDQFVVRKFRLPSGVEVTADNYSQYAKGLSYPRSRTIRWGNSTANIRLISASTRPASASGLFQPSSLDAPAKWDGLEGKAAKAAVQEFYSRFR